MRFVLTIYLLLIWFSAGSGQNVEIPEPDIPDSLKREIRAKTDSIAKLEARKVDSILTYRPLRIEYTPSLIWEKRKRTVWYYRIVDNDTTFHHVSPIIK
jgi:hypothetical protein